MSVHVIDIGRREDYTEAQTIYPKTCQKCGAPLKDNKCEYCGTEYVDDAKELAELEAELKKSEAELNMKRLKIAQQEQTAMLCRLIKEKL